MRSAVLVAEAVGASAPYVLVDLSDTTGFRHKQTGSIRLYRIRGTAEILSSGVHDIWFGVIVENDATDGSVHWLDTLHLESLGTSGRTNFDFQYGVDQGEQRGGLNLKVDTVNDKLVNVVTNGTQVDNTNWQNDVNRTSPAGTTTNPGEGDLVMWAERISGSGTVDLTVHVDYETEVS